MVDIKVGNLLESDAQTLVNTVNTVGVMGKGIALEFKKRFPEMYADYVQRCNAGTVKLGEPYLFRHLFPPWVLNFPTKDHWRSVSRLSDIVNGLEYLIQHCYEWGITSLAVPPLGCGNGGLEWRVVGPTLYRYLQRLDVPIELYAPHKTPEAELQVDFLSQSSTGSDVVSSQLPLMPLPRMMPGWLALVEIIRRVYQAQYHQPVGHVMFQKVAYFATLSGIQTGLEFSRGSYGPFSPELKPILSRLANNGLIYEEKLGNMLALKPGLTFRDARKRYAAELEQWEPIIQRLTDLFLRIRTTHQAEIAATVHFAAHSLPVDQTTEADVLAEVMKWKERRRPAINEGDVASTIRNLAAMGWIKVEPSSELSFSDEALPL